jgi:O-acetyl-ADP-ribose deacetylase (regulator of RNase III)
MQVPKHIQIKIGDITKECCDAIVNAANSSLLGGGGVDGAIHRAGGSAILDACKILRNSSYPNGLETGKAVATTAGNMCAKYVIHTAGPIYPSCGEQCETLLSACYTNAMSEAIRLSCKSIAFPAISTGIYGYPKAEAAKIAFKSVVDFTQHTKIDVIFIFHSQEDYALFVSVVAAL